MKGILKESYTKSNGRAVFVYYLQGTESELVDYKISTGKYYRVDNNQPLFYTLFYYGDKVNINKSRNKGSYFVKNDEFDQAKSLSEQFGGNLFQTLYDKTKNENWLRTEQNEKLIKEKRDNRKKHTENERKDTFENYRGHYAQDIEGYSDQDIDDIFDGDPDMYWNID